MHVPRAPSASPRHVDPWRRRAGPPAPGGILIGQATYNAVRDEVTVEPFGDLDLKGKPAPVPTFEVRVDPTASA